ncbi:MAG: hypothetical protein JSV01_08695 [Desulfobacterales bacterium]|nr:MAG: hypothetical protein JSV01_08695 [Desulfobacterales bacterium]
MSNKARVGFWKNITGSICVTLLAGTGGTRNLMIALPLGLGPVDPHFGLDFFQY